MLLKLPENRKRIIEYLEAIDEDTFIDEVVIPFFGSLGYQVYRINSHGPGEHGKDIIFYRHVPIFFENEFIAVQAKAENVTTANVNKFSDQLKRALKTKFASRSGSGDLSAHYAIFINARKHTNDAYTEFPQLVNSKHAKILSQENVCELILQTGIAPRHLLDKLSTSSPDVQSKADKLVIDTILSNNPADIDNLIDHKLKFLKQEIGQRTKEIVIDYIYDRWQMDKSWSATVKPMKWFDQYFEFFISERQLKYFLEVFEELTASNPSFDALSYTSSVARKVTTDMLSHFSEEFIHYCARRILLFKNEYDDLVLRKLDKLQREKLVRKDYLNEMAKLILKFRNEELEEEEYEAVKNKIEAFAYPDLVEIRKKRRKTRKKL
ncbi:MAG: hypothetical protein ACYC9T_09315 [Trichloromonadaceae bacterium]